MQSLNTRSVLLGRQQDGTNFSIQIRIAGLAITANDVRQGFWAPCCKHSIDLLNDEAPQSFRNLIDISSLLEVDSVPVSVENGQSPRAIWSVSFWGFVGMLATRVLVCIAFQTWLCRRIITSVRYLSIWRA